MLVHRPDSGVLVKRLVTLGPALPSYMPWTLHVFVDRSLGQYGSKCANCGSGLYLYTY